MVAEKHRVRTFNIQVKLLEEENAMLTKNAYEQGLSKAEYLRTLIMAGGLIGRQWTMDKEQGERLIYEMNRIGNNINQIAYNTNAKTYAANSDWAELKREFIKLLDMIGEIPFLSEEAREEWQQRIFTLLPKQ